MPKPPPLAAPILRVWLRLDRPSPRRYSLRFDVEGGVGRLMPSPPHAPAGLSRGRPGGTVENLDLHELYVMEILTAPRLGESWTRSPVLAGGAAPLSELKPGVWVELSIGADALRLGGSGARGERADSASTGSPAPSDELPTEARGLLSLPRLDEEPLPPLDDDAPTDLSLLPPPMARLQALRRRRDLDNQG